MYYDKGAAKKKLDFFLTYLQYYVCIKEALPMDVEFIVQDAFNLVRPQWKIVTNLEEASRVFAEAVKQNYQTASADKPVEPDEDDMSASDDDLDGAEDEDVVLPDGEGDKSSGDEDEDSDDDEPMKQTSSDEEEEQIVVTRQEDERDPEADAEFDRELAKLMSESAESRKHDRKPVFDVPLPMRRAREAPVSADDVGSEVPVPVAPAPSQTMKFSLLSKRGNRTQTRSIDLPSDSTFAVAMRNKQQADTEERQRIKSLVLNYNEARDDADDTTGDSPFHYTLSPNTNRIRTETFQGLDKTPNPYAQPRLDKAGANRSNQRARKLQLSDVNWYDSQPSPRQSRPEPGATSASMHTPLSVFTSKR
jgi:regulator of nonsense transcripts 2